MYKDIFESIENAMNDNRSITWILNNCVGCGWDCEEYYNFCTKLMEKAEEMHIAVRDRWIELAEACWEGFYETDWEEDDPYL